MVRSSPRDDAVVVHTGLAAVVDLVLPATCAACGVPARRLCGACSAHLLAQLVRFGGPTWVIPDPAPSDWPGCVAVTAYEGVARRLVATYKDDDRRGVRQILAPLLAAGLLAALTSLRPGSGTTDGPFVVVPAPTSRSARRRRGRDSLGELARAAAVLLPGQVSVLDLLAQSRGVRDQAALGAVDRRANLAGAVRVRSAHRGRLDGLGCVIVDDVVTTGATLVECSRALTADGAQVRGAVVVCATQRRSGDGLLGRIGRTEGVGSLQPLDAGPLWRGDLSPRPAVG